jgi:hypothetical protein
LPAGFNNGVVLKMPAVTDPGAASASGELIFGVGTQANNALPANATQVYLGVDYANHPNSYLNVSTFYKGQTYPGSYLDTGTNGLFFNDLSTPACGTTASPSPWYCPAQSMPVSAVVSNGDNPALNPVTVSFQIGNAEALFSTQNTAFSDLAGTSGSSSVGPASFAWGMPFFYGRQVFLSLWDITHPQNNPPWYAWAPL